MQSACGCCTGEAYKYYWGTETFMSPELLENRLQRQRKEDMSTDVNPQSTDIYANGVMLTILLRSALRQVRACHTVLDPSSVLFFVCDLLI